jgi:hypothetical protein
MRRSIARSTTRPPSAFVLLALLVASGLSLAPSGCQLPQGVYGLTDDSTFATGCFPPLACPGVVAESLVGTFRLTKVPFAEPSAAPSRFDTYLVTDVDWLARYPGEDVPITGSGTYTRGGESELTQRMQLDLQVGDAEVQRFDSGLVPVDQVGPGIDVTISINGMQFVDTVIRVRAILLPAESEASAASAPMEP